ncbi:MAG: GNAT family N-acetyltransferase [Planctomycetes bacterium]|nr:GNAT family N-acetyltransferase [Planctomycetota bacterium]
MMKAESPEDKTPIRSATPDDIEQVETLIGPFVEQRMLLPRTQEELAKLIPNGFVAECDGEVVGFAAVEIYSQRLAELQCMAVAKRLHGRGIGRRLVECCVQRAREQGVFELMAITASEAMFRSCGFDYSLPDQKRALFIQTRNRD